MLDVFISFKGVTRHSITELPRKKVHGHEKEVFENPHKTVSLKLSNVNEN